MSGSNTSYTVASGGTITGGGSNDTIHMLGGGYVGLTAGSGDTVDMSGGILQALTGVTNIILNGSNDSVMTGANSIFDLNGSNGTINAGNDAYVGILAGNGDLVSLNGGTLQIASSVTNLLLGGSGVTIMGSNNDSMNVDGNNDLINMGTGCYVGILAGNDDSIEMNDGTLQTAASVTNMYLVGNYNTVATGGCSSIQIDGSDNFIVMGTNSYDGLLVGNGDSVSMSNGTLQAAASIGNILLMGSNDEALIDPSGQLSVNGSYDVINTGTSCVVGLLAGNYDTVNMSYGALDVSSGVLNALLNGIYDTVEVFAGANITITGGSDILEMGAGDTVSILSGTGDSITLTNGTLNLLNLYPSPSINNLTLVGSGDVIYSYTQDTLTAGANDTAVVNGASNSITLGSGGVVDLISGNGNNFFLSSGKINWGAGYSGGVYGSSDTIIGGSSADIYLVGSNDAVTLGADSLLNLGGGTNNNITLASGTVDLAASSTDGIVGTSNTIVASISDGVYISGDGNTLTASGTDFVSLVVGTNETFHMVTSTLSMGSTLDTTDVLIGSWNTVSMGADSTLSVTGNHNIINAAPGATVTLTGSDSGDIIDLIGGTIYLGAGLSNVTIVGTGDQLIGPDASSFGSASTVTVNHVGPGGTLIPVTTTFAVVYDPADIQDLVTYFEANPNLSQSQIAAAESDSNYQSSLEAYLSTANVYGSSNSLPPNVLAMLDGYSSLYMALTGVPDADLAKDVYIEQQFSWVESTYLDPTNGDPCLPVDGLSTVLQNLMPALLSTNTTTQTDITNAITYLEDGQAGAPQGNQAPLLDDTLAKLELESAESPSGTSFSDLVYTPGRSTHWKVVLTQPGNNYTFTAESSPIITQVLSDIDTYVGPLIDLAAIISLNPEIIGLTALPALATTSIEVASTAYSLVQAGQDFANGEDLNGAFSVLGAIGGSLQQIGAAGQTAAEGNGLGFDVDAGLEQDVGQVLSNGVAAVDGAYGVDIAAQSGNVLAAITSSFGAVGGVAGVAGESTLQQFAQLGQGLASTALSGEQGDVLGALQSLVQSANAYQNLGGTTGILQDIGALWSSFVQSFEGIIPSASSSTYGTGHYSYVGSDYPSKAIPKSVTDGDGGYKLLYNRNNQVVGISFLDPTDTHDSINNDGNKDIISGVQAIADNDGVTTSFVWIVAGHGSDVGLYSSPLPSAAPISPESVNLTDIAAGYVPGTTVQLIACNTASPNSSPITYQYNGVAPGTNFAQTLAKLSLSPVMGADGYIDIFVNGSYDVDLSPGSDKNDGKIVSYRGDNGLVVPVPTLFAQ